jgi:hypothetical protein
VPCDSAERLERAGTNGVKFDFGVDRPEALPCGVGDLAVIFSWRGYPAAHDADPVGKPSLNLCRTLELVSQLLEQGMEQVFYASTGAVGIFWEPWFARYPYAAEKTLLRYMALFPVWSAHWMLKWFFKFLALARFVEFQMRYYLGNFFLLKKVRNSIKIQS